MASQNEFASNALNTASFVEHGVDLRTGLYTVSVNLPELKGNLLGGPDLALTLRFSPINPLNSGFGTGWDLPMSHYQPTTRVLTLFTGETLKVTGAGPAPEIAEQKLQTFKFYDDGNGRYRVVHLSGLTEVLEVKSMQGNQTAVPVEHVSALGHRLLFNYGFHGVYPRLSEVRQADGTVLLDISTSSNSINLRYRGAGDDPVHSTFILQTESNELRRILLPTSDGAQWRFDYQTLNGYLCMASLRSPQGALETVEHNGRHRFPGEREKSLPRVTRHRIDPGRGQPTAETRYTYSEHNFLGLGALGLTFEHDGLDNLYRVTDGYTYSTTQTHYRGDVALRTVESLYNRYHLMTERINTQGNCRQIQTLEYLIDDDLPFDLQAPQCQFVQRSQQRWTLVDDPTQVRDVIEVTRYDAYGNLVEKIDSTGVRETWAFYSPLGEPGCPADPQGFCRHLKEHRRQAAVSAPRRRVYPVTPGGQRLRPLPHPAVDGQGDASAHYITRHTYREHPPLAGASDRPVLLHQSTQSAQTGDQEQTLKQTVIDYHDAPDHPERHGKPHVTVVEHSGHSVTVTHGYALGERPGALTITEDMSFSLDASRRHSVQRLALHSGLVLEVETPEGRRVVSEYDRLRRPVVERVTSADDLYTAQRTFAYSWPDGAGLWAEHSVISATGVRTVTRLDGLGRLIERLRQTGDTLADAEPLRLEYSAVYDARMLLVQETEHDWLDALPLAVTTAYAYDDWGQRCEAISADGLRSHTRYDPFECSLTEWQEGMARTVTRFNAFGKPITVATFAPDAAATDAWLDFERNDYDGYGQLRTHIDTQGARTALEYDLFGRITRKRLADGTCVDHQYADHSSAALISGLHLTHGRQASRRQRLGTQRFDALERPTHRQVGPRITELRYRGDLNVVEERITPALQSIRHDYELALTDAPTSTQADEACAFEYDPVTAALVAAQSPQGAVAYAYDREGRLLSQISEAQGHRREIHYQTSPLGKAMAQRDVYPGGEHQKTIAYEGFGRIRQCKDGALETDLEYDALGQVCRISTQDTHSGNAHCTALEYDARGREVLRIQTMTRSAEHRTALCWGVDDLLQRRETTLGGALSLREDFVYDCRGRLVEHRLQGTDLPSDRYGQPIVAQRFEFDGLDNLLWCTTQFQDGSEDEAAYLYADDDPCQLRTVTHTHARYPARTLLHHDADGNLIDKGDGRLSHYDRQGRLIKVTDADASLLCGYRYDAHDHLLGTHDASGGQTLRYYQDHRLHSTAHNDQARFFSYAGDVPVGQQRVDDPEQTLLVQCDQNHSVIAELKGRGDVVRRRYSGYGEPDVALESALGFNGEVREQHTGWYLLGSGYRAYDPELMRFHSPDDASPFGAGGLNPYAYCLGNPIGYRDPTGHFAHPALAWYEWDQENQRAFQKGVIKSFLIGAAFTAGFAALSFFTGGMALSTGFLVSTAVDLMDLTLRTAVTMNARTSDSANAILKWWDQVDTVQMVAMGPMMIHGGLSYAATRMERKAFKRSAVGIAQRRLLSGVDDVPRRSSIADGAPTARTAPALEPRRPRSASVGASPAASSLPIERPTPARPRPSADATVPQARETPNAPQDRASAHSGESVSSEPSGASQASAAPSPQRRTAPLFDGVVEARNRMLEIRSGG